MRRLLVIALLLAVCAGCGSDPVLTEGTVKAKVDGCEVLS